MASKNKGFLPFILELFIVFVGVYGAFELNRYQQNQREDKIRQSYFISFKSELVKLSYDIKAVQDVLDNRISNLETSLKNKDRIPLKPLNLHFDAAMLITRAGFNDDVFMQLDPGLASSLSGGYDHVRNTSEQIRAFNETCNRILISTEPISFYDSKGNLKSQFDWYLQGLKSLRKQIEFLANMINNGAMPATEKLIKDF